MFNYSFKLKTLIRFIEDKQSKMMKPDGTFQEDIQCIVPQQNGKGAIFVSNLQAACNPNTLKNHNIGAVITAIKGKNLQDKIPPHLQYFYIPVVDHESCDISIYFKDSYDFIQQQRKRTNVLVHCMAGVSRSITLIIAYIMQKSCIPYETAYNYVKSKRSIIHPNQSFIEQLKKLQRKLQNKPQQKKLQTIQNKCTKNDNIQNKQINQNKQSKLNNQSKQSNQNKQSKQSTMNSFYQKSMISSKVQSIKDFGVKNIPDAKIHKQSFVMENVEKINNRQKAKIQQIKETDYDRMLRDNIKKLFSMSQSKLQISQLRIR